MHVRTRNLFTRSVAGVAIAGAAALAAPALASAAPAVKAPTVTAAAASSTITVTVANPNTDPSVTCGAHAFAASRASELEKDPSKLFEPGFTFWKVSDKARVGASDTKSFTTPEFNDGVFAVVGECTSANGGTPVLGKPQVVSLPEDAIFGSLRNGALENVLDFVLEGNIDGLIKAISAGSSQPA
ncbi:hypothetical protein AB4Z09_03360 [Rhodococcus sp. TAF43]|uniref:hypothetical protein n=1 Tax=unclassified Rhodococcus (in: high G+C Gram-positive bacteria) TaxID=192944 RepID=UPI003D1C9B2C